MLLQEEEEEEEEEWERGHFPTGKNMLKNDEFTLAMRRRMGAMKPTDPDPDVAFPARPHGSEGDANSGFQYDDEDDDEDVGAYGFTRAEEMELMSQGVKPWEEGAAGVLAALNSEY